jgi:hypothetical protein
MDNLYIKREIELSSLLGEELPGDVKEIIDYFKSLTFRYEKYDNGIETWYDENNQWTIQIWEEKWRYSYFYSKKWDFLEGKYGLNYNQTSELVKGMLELTLNRKVSTPAFDKGNPSTGWS